MRIGKVVSSPPHKRRERDLDKWLECYPTIKECKDLDSVSPEDRTYCETIGHKSQSPRLVRLTAAKKKGWIE